MAKKIFIGVAWPYVNGDLHVGHLAGYLIPCDVFARWARLAGHEVLMVSGTDCHGTPITLEADKRGITPSRLIDEYTPKIHQLIKTYGISYDLFTSTTTANHRQTTQQFFLNLLKNGYIIKKKSLQYYSKAEQKFLPDRYVEGECPYCHAKNQRADQCEVCGRVLDFGELINPVSKLTNQPITLKQTQHYYLDFAKLQPLIEKYVKPSTHWRSWVYKETIGWLAEGLKPRPITRDLDWGVPLPVDQIPKDMLIEGAEHKRFYVWFDAVIGYFSASLEWAQKTGQPDKWQDFWLDKKTLHYYFMGQDNLTFHTIFWPGQLIGQHRNYNLPYFPCVNKYLNLEGQKFSKSRNIIIDSLEVAQKYGVDAVRFYILSILPETKPANWQWLEFENLVNANLVDNIGNFIQRILGFYAQKLNQQISPANQVVDPEVVKLTQQTFDQINQLMPACQIKNSLELIIRYAGSGNKYLNQTQPWNLIKTDPAKAQKVIFTGLYIVYNLSLLLRPFLPSSSAKLSKLLNLPLAAPQPGQNAYQPITNQPPPANLDLSIFPLFAKLKT
ncbi:MAG: methionine--tRNA ligase [bacterium]|nr:methionine--tRNA ligase [bacterium]